MGMTATAREIHKHEPEGCECDQVQLLRAERDSAREALESSRKYWFEHFRQQQKELELARTEWRKHERHAEQLRQKMAEARDHASEARRAGINDDVESAAAHAADAVRVLTLAHDTGEAKPAEPDIHAGILADPRMDGETWNTARSVTQDMLDAWPVWETCGDPGAVSFMPVIKPSLEEVHAASLVFWRPLRLPGMNRDGEIPATAMTQWHFVRANKWEWGDMEEVPRMWHSLPWQPLMSDVDVLNGHELWRPTIFAEVK